MNRAVRWLCGLFGDDKFQNIIEISFFGSDVSDADLACLEGLTNLHMLVLEGTHVTDAGLANFKGLTSLRTLNLNYTLVSDAGLAHLKGLTNLQVLEPYVDQGNSDGIKKLPSRQIIISP